jgi:non-ribosomal peptide synthase protein (TIGR01720 family)
MSGDQALRQQLSSVPQGRVCFNYHGQFNQMAGQNEWFRDATESAGVNRCASQRRAYLFEINAGVSADQFHINWIYSRNIHHPQTAARYYRTLPAMPG